MIMPSHKAPPAMTPGKAIVGVLLITAGVAAFLAIAYGLHIGPSYMGFLFALYIGTFERMNPRMFIPALVGALAGIANAAAFALLPGILGQAIGLSIALFFTFAGVFCLLIGWLKAAINGSYLLSLTVACIPVAQNPPPFLGMVAAVLLGAVFMAALLLIGGLFTRRQKVVAG